MTVSRSGNQGDRLAGPSPALVLHPMAELRFATNEGLVDLDHSGLPPGDVLPIIHHLANGIAELPCGFLVHAENARHHD